MSRIVINNKSRFADGYVIGLVAQVMDHGRVSRSRGRDHYCHASTFARGTCIYAGITDTGTDTFTVEDDGSGDPAPRTQQAGGGK